MVANQRVFLQCPYPTLVITENDEICSLDAGKELARERVSPAPGLNDHCLRCSRNVHNPLDPLAK